MAPLSGYRRLLERPVVPSVLAATTIGGMPSGMLPLGLVLLGHRTTGSFAAAGVIASGVVVGNAATAAARGRLVDRVGSPALRVLTVIRTCALSGLVAAAAAGAPVAALTALAALAGVTNPPLLQALRAMWQGLVPDEERDMAFSIQAIVAQTLFVAGPLLMAMLAAGFGPLVGVAVATAMGLLGTLWLTSLPAVRTLLGQESPPPSRWGAAASPGVRCLTAIAVPLGILLGTLDIAFPARAAEFGSAEAGGLALAAMGAGSIGGGLWYGAQRWRWPPARRLGLCLVALAVGAGMPLLATSLPALVLTAAVAGLGLAPVNATIYALLDTVRPSGTGTEALGWVIAALAAGGAAGTLAAGIIVEAASTRWSLVLAPAAVVASLVVLALWRRTLTQAPATAGRLRGAGE